MKSESKRPVSVEDLLRLKRAERPPAEFWNQFDRELRAKQLAALVEKRPWWHGLPRAFSGFPRYRVPLGAAAVAALAFVAVRDQNPAGAGAPQGLSGPTAVAASASSEAPSAAAMAIESSYEAAAEVRVLPASVAAHVEPPSLAPASLASEATAPGELSRMIPLLGAPGSEPAAEPSPSSRRIAANLAAVQAAEPVISRGLLGTTQGLEGRSMAARPAVEPLQQITPPSETRRARYMNALVAMASHDTSPRATERVANRIAEERLYDRVHRFSAQGDQVRVKF
jgi:hypothetical protein